MTSSNEPIRIWNRAESREELENIYGDAMIRWVYGSRPGQALADRLLSGAAISKIYGAYQSSSASRHKIEPFIRQFSIPMGEFEPGPFRTFNDFFIRKFRPGARPFVQDSQQMAAFAEARYLAWESVSPQEVFPVKGAMLTPAKLLADEELASGFDGGALMIARLCPVDYHRFHYPDSGTIKRHYRVPGRLHSVNPLALRYRNEIFATNERQISILETDHFGRLAYIEVGALCVGKIRQSDPQVPGRRFVRGQEKGYFLFGASTVIILGEKGKWLPARDILEQTARRRETLIQLGAPIGASLP